MSLAYFLQNVGGTLPAPMVYGLIAEWYSDRAAMRMLMYVPCVTVFFFLFAMILLIRNKTLDNTGSVQDQDQDQIEIEMN